MMKHDENVLFAGKLAARVMKFYGQEKYCVDRQPAWRYAGAEYLGDNVFAVRVALAPGMVVDADDFLHALVADDRLDAFMEGDLGANHAVALVHR